MTIACDPLMDVLAAGRVATVRRLLVSSITMPKLPGGMSYPAAPPVK